MTPCSARYHSVKSQCWKKDNAALVVKVGKCAFNNLICILPAREQNEFCFFAFKFPAITHMDSMSETKKRTDQEVSNNSMEYNFRYSLNISKINYIII